MENNLINVSEALAKERLDAALENNDNVCKCAKCYGDMLAMVLNKIPARYVNSDIGSLFKKLDATTSPQAQMDIDIAVEQAIAVVSQRPKH